MRRRVRVIVRGSKGPEMSNQRFGFKRSYLRKSFWRANGMIAAIVGLLGVLVVVIYVMSRSEAEVSDTRAAAPEIARP